MKDGIGVLGYDPIQGALSPILRFLCHCSAILILWGCICWSTLFSFDSAALVDLSSVLLVGIVVVGMYSLFFYYKFHLGPGVSVPGGPRPHKIQRHPQWENKNWDIVVSSSQSTVPQYVTAQESHFVSESIFAGTCAAISGEPFGRDMWTTKTNNDSPTKATKMDEEMIRSMASGGRPYSGFNPHLNPNR
jgi:hypothetical protein